MEKILDKDSIVREQEKINYKIYNTGIYFTPVALVITHFNKENSRFVKSGKEYNSALYFDRKGKIVDRAPANTYTNARQLQDKFSEIIRENMNKKGKKIEHHIRGFFEREAGINRVQYVKDKKFVREDL